MIKVLGLARNTVKNSIIRFVIVIISVATVCSIYFRAQKAEAPPSENTIDQVHNPDIRGAKGFAWFQHWDELDLATVKKYYQRYTVDDMQILWDVQLHDKFGNYAGKAHAETVYPWDAYLARLLELGHPFISFSDYESALDTRMGILIPARTYWHKMAVSERGGYLKARGLSPDTTWEMYEESLIKQIIVYRINWWLSGGMVPFPKSKLR